MIEGIPRTTYFLLGNDAPWAMANALWSALEDHAVTPDQTVILVHARHKAAVEQVKPALTLILKAFNQRTDIFTEVIPEDDLTKAFKRIVEVLGEATVKGEVVLDITPARKSLASVAMGAAENQGVRRILYLYLKDPGAGDWPYPVIPQVLHTAYDLGDLSR